MKNEDRPVSGSDLIWHIFLEWKHKIPEILLNWREKHEEIDKKSQHMEDYGLKSDRWSHYIRLFASKDG